MLKNILARSKSFQELKKEAEKQLENEEAKEKEVEKEVENEEAKDEAKDEANEEAKDESNEEAKDEANEEAKEEANEEAKDEAEDEAKEISIDDLDDNNPKDLLKKLNIQLTELFGEMKNVVSKNIDNLNSDADEESVNSVLDLVNKSKNLLNNIKDKSVKYSRNNLEEDLGSNINDLIVRILSKSTNMFEEVKKDSESAISFFNKTEDENENEKTLSNKEKITENTEELVGKFSESFAEITKDVKDILNQTVNKNSVIGKKINTSLKEKIALELDEPLDKNVKNRFMKLIKEDLTKQANNKSITEDVLLKIIR